MPSRCANFRCNYKPNATLRCSACNRVWYCNQTCQAEAWSHHKKYCKAVKKWVEPRAKLIFAEYHPIGEWDKIYYRPLHSKKNYLLFITINSVFAYDVQNNEMNEFAKMPKPLADMKENYMFGMPGSVGTFIDTKHDKLYIFSTMHSYDQQLEEINCEMRTHDIITLDLKTKQWNVMTNVLQPNKPRVEGIWYPRLHFVNGTAHCIYVNAEGGHHAIFDFDQCAFVELSNNACMLQAYGGEYGDDFYPAHCVYIGAINKFIVLDLYSQSVCSLDLSKGPEACWEKENGFMWPDRLRTNIKHSAIVAGFGFIIYLFVENHLNQGVVEIRCLDVVDKKWYISGKKVPNYFDEFQEKSYVSTEGRYAHYYGNCFHDIIDLYDVSPKELRIKIDEMMSNDKMLVYGFIREQIEGNKLTFGDLKDMVLSFYSD